VNQADLCTQLLVVLKKLKLNWKENAILYSEVKEFIKQNAGDVDELESLSESFYRQVL